ncbi:MAG: proteasome-activating nucleotidase [Candidatus Jordarchaeales archaeon]
MGRLCIVPGSTENGGSYEEKYEDIVAYARDIEKKLYKLDAERMRLYQEVIQLRRELEALKQPPLISATVLETLDDGRVIVRSTTGPNFVVYASSEIPREKLAPGAHVALSQKTFAIVEVLPTPEDPFVKGMEVEEVPPVTYADIGGLKEQIMEVRETVELPLVRPDLFDEVGIEPPKGVLLCGPPGTGKTLLARAVAHETKATFIRIVGSELVQKFIGEGARIVREVFQLAKKKAPSIVFCDEIDAIGSRRIDVGTSGDREVQRTLMQLLSIMDGFDSRGDVKIIGATNRPDILDPALLRPGRFDRIIYFPLPDLEAREEIFKIHTRRMKLDPSVNLRTLAEITENATGADIKAICTEAGMFAIRDFRTRVTFNDFEKAVEKVLKRSKGESPPRIYS